MIIIPCIFSYVRAFLQFFTFLSVPFFEFGKIFLFYQHTTMGDQDKVYCRLVRLYVWERFVDDSFSIIKETAINSFLNLLNDIDPNISFTIELEQDNKILFPEHL